jgi:hypothetical protein
MVTPLIYIDIFNSRPNYDELIVWLNIKIKARRANKEKKYRGINWTCTDLCEYLDLLMDRVCFKHKDGYIVDGAIYYDQRERKCFELVEL